MHLDALCVLLLWRGIAQRRAFIANCCIHRDYAIYVAVTDDVRESMTHFCSPQIYFLSRAIVHSNADARGDDRSNGVGSHTGVATSIGV